MSLQFVQPTIKPYKRKPRQDTTDLEIDTSDDYTDLIIQFTSQDGQTTGSALQIPKNLTKKELDALLNSILENTDKVPYSFYIDDNEIVDSVDTIVKNHNMSREDVISVLYRPQAMFHVEPVARCTSTLPGHSEAILTVRFSPCGRYLVSGSGDTTVRIWDLLTETPYMTLKGHTNWILDVQWSPCSTKIASAGMDGEIRIWDRQTGKLLGKPLKGHTKPITALAWEPYVANPQCYRLASASKDNTIRVWDTIRCTTLFSLTGHTSPIRALKWGGKGLIYSGSMDRTIKAWSVDDKRLFRSMEGHAHWINCLSLNTEYALRQGPWDHQGLRGDTDEERLKRAQDKYDAIYNVHGELLVSCSDDFTLYLWDPLKTAKPTIRLTGHQQPVNYVQYSPDGNFIASASFDKAVFLWNGISGKLHSKFRGHVQSVYQVAWSADSRMLISSSKDSTLKLWSVKQMKPIGDLPGHSDEVFAVDWSPDGHRVCSGGKDKVLKIWRS